MPGGVINCAATAKMIEDVSERVRMGQAVPTAPNSWTMDHSTRATLRTVQRYAARNKRKIVISTTALVVAGVLTGGVAVGIAAAGKAAGWVAGRLYRRWERWKNEGQVQMLFPDLVDRSTGQFRNIDFGIDSGTGTANVKMAAGMRAVKSLIQHRDFANMVNAFSDLMEAGKDFQTKFDAARGGVRSCAQAIQLLEAMYLFKYHYERLRPAINFLDQYLLFMFLRSETMVGEFGQNVPTVLAKLRTVGTGMYRLNAAANHSRVLHSHSFFTGDQDQYEWVRAALDPWLQASGVQTTMGPASRVSGEATFVDSVQGAVSSSLHVSAVSAGGGQVGSIGTREAISAAGGHVVSASVATSAATGGGEVAVGIVSEIANAKWNSTQYSSGRTLGISGWRDITVSERVHLMRTMLKGSLDRLTTKFDHWMTSHQQFLGGVSLPPTQLDETLIRMLRSRKHWAQSVGSDAFKMLAEFQETVVGMANVEHNKIFENAAHAERMEGFMHRTADGSTAHFAEATSATSSAGIATTRADLVQGLIDDFVGSHPHGSCDGSYCYMPLILAGNQGVPMSSIPAGKEQTPIFPIGTTRFVDFSAV